MVEVADRSDLFGLCGTLLNERFRIDHQVAEGGFAVVYRALQLALDRQVALKVLKTPPGYDQAAQLEFRERFAAEAKTIARLKHPHIVDVYDFDVSVLPSGVLAPWMALEWVDGETLETWLLRRRGQTPSLRLAPADALALLRPVLQALAFAHRQGIVHRDLKPGNVMVTSVEHERSLRVLDFGIAKIVAADEETGTGRTRTGSVPAFSPAYAAPEQVTFSRTGPWTDVHGLGLIMTELLTDQSPYSDPDASAHEQVMATSRPTPRAKGRDVGPVEAVLARAVALAPGARFRNAGELLEALEQAVSSPSRPGSSAFHSAATLPAPDPRGDAARPTTPPGWRRALAVTGMVAVLAALAFGAWASWRGSRSPPAVPITSPAPSPPALDSPPPARAIEVPARATPPPDPAPAVAAPRRQARPVKHGGKNEAPRPLDRGPVDLFDDTK